MKLYFLLLHLFVERLQLCQSRLVTGLGIIHFLLADHSGFKQLLRAIQRNLGVAQVCLLRRARGFLAVHRSFLFQRVDLQEWRSRFHVVA